MKTVNLFTYEDSASAMNEDYNNGIDVSIMKWRSIRDTLAAVKSVVNSQCGLCMQYGLGCGKCSLPRGDKSGEFCCSAFSEIELLLGDCLERADDFVEVLVDIKDEEDNDREG